MGKPGGIPGSNSIFGVPMRNSISLKTDLPKHLNEHEVAERIGISVKTLQRMRHEMRGIPFKKIGRRVIYSEIEVARYLDSHSVSLNP